MNICQRIFDCMGQDKTRLRALAKALGTAPSTVSSWKIRQSDPPAKYIVPIAEFLGVPPLYLLTGKQASTSNSQANTLSEPDAKADRQAYGELNSLYASLDRAGQVIMLAAGYQQQLRVRSASKDDLPPPRTLVLINKILTHSIISQCSCLTAFALAYNGTSVVLLYICSKKVATVCLCAYHSDFLFICIQAPTPSLDEPTYFYLALYP